jgi:hypothetical protein
VLADLLSGAVLSSFSTLRLAATSFRLFLLRESSSRSVLKLTCRFNQGQFFVFGDTFSLFDPYLYLNCERIANATANSSWGDYPSSICSSFIISEIVCITDFKSANIVLKSLLGYFFFEHKVIWNYFTKIYKVFFLLLKARSSCITFKVEQSKKFISGTFH